MHSIERVGLEKQVGRMTNDVGDDMLNSLLEVQRTMSTELLQASMFPFSRFEYSCRAYYFCTVIIGYTMGVRLQLSDYVICLTRA